jgi:hypothetical protein
MILRIAREKVGQRQSPHTKTPHSVMSGAFYFVQRLANATLVTDVKPHSRRSRISAHQILSTTAALPATPLTTYHVYAIGALELTWQGQV